jgi:hypothetical protein
MKESFAEAREGMEEVKDTVSDTYKRRRGNN